MTKTLVVYFSINGTTQSIAVAIAELTYADIFELIPEVPYSPEDLNYQDESSRVSREQSDPAARPKIANRPENLDQYEVVYLGYPLWNEQAPKVMCTFLETSALIGKTIIPFVTSGSSGVGSSATNLEALVPGNTWLQGKRFIRETTQDEVSQWVNHLG